VEEGSSELSRRLSRSVTFLSTYSPTCALFDEREVRDGRMTVKDIL